MRTRSLFLSAALALVLAACGSDGAGPAPTAPVKAGRIEGIFVSQKSDGSDRTPVGDVTVALYTEFFQPGPNIMNPPTPIAETITDEAGRFSFSDLDAGQYYLTAIGGPGYTGMERAQVRENHGAAVILVGCLDCPPPA